MFLHFLQRHDASLALRVGNGQALTQEQEQRRFKKRQRHLAQENRRVHLLRDHLTGEGDLLVVVDNEVQKQLMKA